MLRFQIHIFAGGGVGGQILMLSPETLKSQIHIFAGVGGGVGGQPLMLSPKMLKSQIHIVAHEWWEGLVAKF